MWESGENGGAYGRIFKIFRKKMPRIWSIKSPEPKCNHLCKGTTFIFFTFAEGNTRKIYLKLIKAATCVCVWEGGRERSEWGMGGRESPGCMCFFLLQYYFYF